MHDRGGHRLLPHTYSTDSDYTYRIVEEYKVEYQNWMCGGKLSRLERVGTIRLTLDSAPDSSHLTSQLIFI